MFSVTDPPAPTRTPYGSELLICATSGGLGYSTRLISLTRHKTFTAPGSGTRVLYVLQGFLQIRNERSSRIEEGSHTVLRCPSTIHALLNSVFLLVEEGTG